MNHLTNLQFFVFLFYKILTEFGEKLKVVSTKLSMIKYIVAALSSSRLPMKLIYCFKSGFSNSICLLKSMQLIFDVLERIHNLINYHLCNHFFFHFNIVFHVFVLYFFIGTSKKGYYQLIH